MWSNQEKNMVDPLQAKYGTEILSDKNQTICLLWVPLTLLWMQPQKVCKNWKKIQGQEVDCYFTAIDEETVVFLHMLMLNQESMH
jgi:hypothetical protein